MCYLNGGVGGWEWDLYHHQEVVNKMLKSFQPPIYVHEILCDDSYENDKTKIIHINLIFAFKGKESEHIHTHT